MSVYLKLFHGRNTPDEELEGWGFGGPTLGPLNYVHMTYGDNVKVGWGDREEDMFSLWEDMICYDGKWYGDWSVHGQDQLSGTNSVTPYEPKKANAIPDWDPPVSKLIEAICEGLGNQSDDLVMEWSYLTGLKVRGASHESACVDHEALAELHVTLGFTKHIGVDQMISAINQMQKKGN